VDIRSGEPFSYYAQHLLVSGRIDSTWSPGAGALCMGTTDNLNQILCRDRAGGTYAGWVDSRSGNTDIFLQHLKTDGAIASGWPADGLPVCQAPYSQYNLDLASDDAGGVFLVWQDFRSGGAGDIYAQHITSLATPALGWPVGGLALCTNPAAQSYPRIARDGSGGALVVWEDRRGGRLALWAQHVSAGGAPASGWPADGAALTSGPGEDEVMPALSSDSTGTVTVVWRAEGPDGSGLHAIQVGPGYSPVQGSLPLDHVLAAGEASVGSPAVLALRGGTTLVAWASRASGGSAGESHLHLQQLGQEGAPDHTWPAGGALVCTSTLGKSAPCIVAQADSGAIIAWEDFRDGTSDIFVQRVDVRGAVASGWTPNGVAVCVAPGQQYAPSLVADGAGGVLATWADADASTRASFSSARPANGELATLSVAAAHPGHAHVVWNVATNLGGTLTVQRRVGSEGTWGLLSAVAPDDSSHVVLDDRTAPEGAHVEYRLVVQGRGFVQYLDAVALEIPAAPLRLDLHRAWANARQNAIVLSLALPRGDAPIVDLMDVMGRRMQRQVFGGLEPGEQTIRLGVSSHLASGIYFVRLLQGPEARSAKVVFIR
jgi:hypothetical protein